MLDFDTSISYMHIVLLKFVYPMTIQGKIISHNST